MTVAFLLPPLVACLVFAALSSGWHRRLPPRPATWACTAALGAITVAIVPTVWVLAVGFVSHAADVTSVTGWCFHMIGMHHPVTPWVGIPAVLLTVAGGLRMTRVVVRYWRLRDDDTGGVEVAEHPAPFAFTMPGRAGHIFISTGMCSMLEPHEEAVVLAHEGAHARFRHDRFLLFGQVAVALVPPLRLLCRHLVFSLERWADEAAVDHCGDRRLVARTLGRVALVAAAPRQRLAFGDVGVAGRMRALLAEPVPVPPLAAVVGLVSATCAAAAFAAFQLHHVAEFLAHLCHT